MAVAQELGAATVTHDPDSLPRGAYDAVLDTSGVDLSTGLIEGGRYVSVADTPLPEVPDAAKSYVQESSTDLARVVELADAGALRARVAEHHPVGQVRTAHERFEAGGLPGKVVLLF